MKSYIIKENAIYLHVDGGEVLVRRCASEDEARHIINVALYHRRREDAAARKEARRQGIRNTWL